MDDRVLVESEIQAHQPEQGHREAYCSCGAPIGLWGTEWPKHVADRIVAMLEAAHAPA